VLVSETKIENCESVIGKRTKAIEIRKMDDDNDDDG